MIPAYDESYLNSAQNALGTMFDYAVYDLKYDIDSFASMFLKSDLSYGFESGDCSIVAGRSGYELAHMVIEDTQGKYLNIDPRYAGNNSAEFWAGWALAYFQWSSGMSFDRIITVTPLSEILKLYTPYHEMDIRQFCDYMDTQYHPVHVNADDALNVTHKSTIQKLIEPITAVPSQKIFKSSARKTAAKKSRPPSGHLSRRPAGRKKAYAPLYAHSDKGYTRRRKG